MSRITRRSALQSIGALAGLGVTGSVLGNRTDDESSRQETYNTRRNRESRFLGTWTASPQAPLSEGTSAQGFENETLRLMTRTSVGGHGVRIRLSNAFGEAPVTFDRVSLGIRAEGATIAPGTLQEVTFGGDSSVTIPPGARVISDPVDQQVAAEQDLAVNLYTESATGPATWHQLETKTSYVSAGDYTGTTSGDAFTTSVPQWFFLEGVEVVAPNKEGAIVCFGNSITDGHGSTFDANATYPDVLAERINEHHGLRKSVLNAGISGNRVLNNSSSFGENALARFDRDVLTQTGVTDIILLEGINDIGFERNEGPEYQPATSVTAEEIIDGYQQLIRRAHAQGIRIFGGTLTPFKGAAYYYEEGEQKRQAVNEFIRTSGEFDGVIDFDKAIRDPADPQRVLPKYDSGDNLHPSDAGYRAMAEAVDLSLFQGHGQSSQSSERKGSQAAD